ncbi:hypothetical protein [Emticicia sp. TH156]|uniref:hypothetical protein n=1 Tax=Emticicia sp. TH156 TaxID=2067454 RepID=UPI000C782306|nr:hypothetical protein [Emticicia sp. TH156]PLK42652.1 hypothetical protein C0V77_19130 [Emticicia sp. TH156]
MNPLRKQSIIVIQLTLLFFTSFGIPVSQAQIAIGIAYKPMSGSCKQFNEAVGYASKINGGKLKDITKVVSDLLSSQYNVSSSNVMIFSSTSKKGAVILRYKKPISGYNCLKSAYAVGFGNTVGEALNAAKKEMRLYYSGNEYWQETWVH